MAEEGHKKSFSNQKIGESKTKPHSFNGLSVDCVERLQETKRKLELKREGLLRNLADTNKRIESIELQLATPSLFIENAKFFY